LRQLALNALVLLLMSVGFGSTANAQVSVNIRIGQPPAPRVVHAVPARPGPNFVWVQGYWYPVNNRYVWHDGYWTRPPYESAHWVQPRYEGQHYYYGHWDGNHGRVEHEHGWDKKKDRDYKHGHGGGHDNWPLYDGFEYVERDSRSLNRS
jgi:hypothetical protein